MATHAQSQHTNEKLLHHKTHKTSTSTVKTFVHSFEKF